MMSFCAWNFLPLEMPSESFLIAVGWSPVGLNLETISNRRSFSIKTCKTQLFTIIFSFHAQERIDESIKVSIHHRLDISNLKRGPIIFNQSIWTEDIRADLTAPFNILLFANDGVKLVLSLF